MTIQNSVHPIGNGLETKPLMNQTPENTQRELPDFLQKDEKPWVPTAFEKTVKYFNPFLKYVFNIKPAIPNVIYVLVSVGAIQLLQAKEFFPKVDWIEPVLFYGLLAGIAVQILFASAKTITIPLLTLGASAWAIWAQTSQGIQLPIEKEIFQYMMALGTLGIIVSALFNP